MTWCEFWRCDACGKISENYECSLNQMKYSLVESHDFGRTFHFCTLECLRLFVGRPQEEWKNDLGEAEKMHSECIGDHTDRAAGRDKIRG